MPGDFAEVFRHDFETEYERRYGHLDPHSDIEIVELEVVAEARIGRPAIHEMSTTTGSASQIKSYFELEGPCTSEVMSRATLRGGDSVSGPAVLYEEGATTVIPPGATGVVRPGGELVLDVSGLRR